MPSKSIRALCAALFLCIATPLAAAPEIQEWRTSNGAGVLFIAADALPMVDVRLVFDAGSARDASAFGVAQLTNALLGEGAGERDANAIAATFEGLGARFSSGAEHDMATVSLRSLTDPALLDPALELFASVIAEPSFPADAFERVRGQMQVALQAEQQSPGDLASKAFYRAVYDDHPYGNPPNGTQESLAALTREDVVAFFGRYYVARNALVAIVGDLDRAAAEALAEQVTAGLAPGDKAPDLPPVPKLLVPISVHIDHPSAQTHVLLGQPGMHRGDPDYFALYLGNHALGGSGLVSRLNEEVREKRGLAYSVYSYFVPMRRDGPFQMALQTRGDQAGEALAILRDNLERYVAEGPTPEEFAFSKRNVIGGYPLRIDSNGKLIGYLAMIGFYDLPRDYLGRFIERVEAVDRGQVIDALARRLDPDRLVTVTVGPSNPLGG
jgi:zinc protease